MLVLPGLATALADLSRLVVPVECPGCGERDVRWCEECAAVWWEPPLRCESLAPRLDVQGRPPLPVWAPTSLAGPAHGFLAAWKDAGRRDLDGLLLGAMARAAHSIGPSFAGLQQPLTVVEVPSRPGAVHRRGRNLPVSLARAAAAGLGRGGPARHHPRVLRMGRGEQRGGSAQRRWAGMSGAVTVRKPARPGPIVLVDDVMTTGATLAAAATALERAGMVAVGAIVLAVAEASRIEGPTGLG